MLCEPRLNGGLWYVLKQLEYDTARSGGFEPLRYLPRGKVVVLGLLSTKTPKLEDFFVLKARIMEAADAMTRGDIPRTQKEALAQYVSSIRVSRLFHVRDADTLYYIA